MAWASIALQFRPKHRRIRSPSFIQFFSFTTSDSKNDEDEDENITSSPPPSPPSQSQSSFSSYFSDVKASLKQNPPQHQQRQLRNPFPLSSTLPSAQTPTKALSIEEIRASLYEFRRRSAPPHPGHKSSPPPPSSSQQHISFQDLYKRNVISKGQDSSNEASKDDRLSFAAMRESLHQLRSNVAKNQVNKNDHMSLSGFKETLKLRPVNPNARDSTVVIGGTDKLTGSVFAKEMMEKKEGQSPAMKTEFVKVYGYKELGEKLKKLRPEAKRGNWFSLGELNERLMKLREMEEKEAESSIGGLPYNDLRQSLIKMRILDTEKTKKQTIQRLDILGQLGGTPNFMLSPPKEHLVEKYFHPDNMSSSEKMKLELEKVRDEFKMSESDCGSARVQVAQLTTKIKHLSTALHKKDKHSRKGLQAMVQKRKKLLKYLRRTDWDSYCLVLSKLGLRDNPDFKILTYP